MEKQSELSYAGVPLLLDVNRQAQQFLDRYLPVEQMIAPPDNPARGDWHNNAMGQGFIGLPRPNYPPPPRPQVNTLYWPTGAARWARGWFLCDQAGVDKLLDTKRSDSPWYNQKSIGKEFRASTPQVGETDPYVLIANLYMLRPRQITATGDETFGDLWLVPLVDRRYFWQTCRFSFSTYAAPELASWASLIKWLLNFSDAMDASKDFSSTIPSISDAYMRPDPIELYRMGQNLAVVMDAVAASVGRRVVLHYDGKIEFADSQKVDLNDAAKQDDPQLGQQAGVKATPGDLPSTCPTAAPLPDYVQVFFPRVEDPGGYGATMYGSAVYLSKVRDELKIDESDVIETIQSGHTVLCTAWAMYQCGTLDDPTEDPPPSNKTNLDALARQYAKDYYGWLKYEFDYAWPGVKKWTPQGIEDHIFFEFGTEYVAELDAIAQPDNDAAAELVTIRQNLARRYMTRVQSMPANHGVTSLLCQYEHAIPGVADGLMVLTPAGGIEARDCLDISSACCCVYNSVPNGDGTATMEPVYCSDSIVPWKIRVYNIANVAVSGDDFVLTDLLKNGLRIVTVESCSDDDCATCAASS